MQTKMLFALFMGLEILWSKWLTKSGPAFSIKLSLLTYILNSLLLLSSMINTKPFVMFTIKPRFEKKLTFDMLTFGLGTTHLEL
jgi:hypothetical protein